MEFDWMPSVEDALSRLGHVTGKQSLLAPEVVEHLVREFLESVLDLEDETVTKPDTEVWDEVWRLCERFQATFYGKRSGFVASRAWHSPEALGRYLCETCALGGDTHDALLRFCYVTALRLMQLQRQHLEDGLSTSQFRLAMELMVERCVHCLRGVRFPLH